MSYYGRLWITDKHEGKMEGFGSCSTCRNCNPWCPLYANIKGSICADCFAKKYLAMRKALKGHLEDNYKILTESVLPTEELPFLNYAFFRIEAFGDIANVNHAMNYINLIKRNPHVHFGWWTKNCDILAKAIEDVGKPANVQIIRSSLFINKPVRNKYWFVDKTFTVYDKQFINENNISINCGGRKCFECLKCYLPNGAKEIREQKK